MRGWLHTSCGNDFYVLGGIVAMVRFRLGAFYVYDLCSEDWPRPSGTYSPLAIGSYPVLEQAKAAVEARFE